MMKEFSVLISDTSPTIIQHLKTLIEQLGIKVYIANDGDECLRQIIAYKPNVAIIDLLLTKKNALAILQSLNMADPKFTERTKVIVLSNQGLISNIKECMKMGATDFLLKPIDADEIVSRVVFHLQPARNQVHSEESSNTSFLYLNLVDLILKQLTLHRNLSDTLKKLVQMSSMTLKSVRASVILKKPQRTGVVKASSDDTTGKEWVLDLRKYPEILYVLNTGKVLAVENLESDPTLNKIKQFFTTIQFNSMIVIPLTLNDDDPFGALSIRMPSSRQEISDEELRFAQIVGQCVSLCFRLYSTEEEP